MKRFPDTRCGRKWGGFGWTVLFLTLVVVIGPSRGATPASYPFTGDSLASDDTDPDSTAGDLSVGAGLSGKGQFRTYFTGPAFGVFSSDTPSSEALAISGNHYFSITVTPVNGSYDFTTLFCNLNAEANNIFGTYTPNVSIRWSVDGFATNLTTASATISPGQSTSKGVSADLTSFAAQNVPVEFRFYLFDDQDESMFTFLALDNLSLTGTFAPNPVFEADAQLGTTVNTPVGADLINLTAAGQSLAASIRRNGGVKVVFVRVVNSGNQPDSFTILGTGGNGLFPVKYQEGGINVTAPVVGGTHPTPTLAPGASHLLTAKITARTRLARKTRSFFIKATSVTAPAAADRVLIRARSR